jgi:cytochrome c oxidase assembly protein subunit 15
MTVTDVIKTAIAADPHDRAIRWWLYAVAALVLAMVVVGGATRLTESGLSITEWKPVMGSLPPLSQADWQEAFAKYQLIPQYKALNAGMTLSEFKAIFWWEWSHRLLGRLIGAAYLLPFLWFLARGRVAAELKPRLWFVFALGALQGAVGWWMVASGLADRIEVSQYRLATHLVLASLIYVALIFTGRRMARVPAIAVPPRVKYGAVALIVLILVQLYFGALVAGLRAGLIYNTWPLIDGGLIPGADKLFFNTPLWRNLFENTLTVQFDHRMLAYAIWVVAVFHLVDAARARNRRLLAGGAVTLTMLTLQIALGIWTLLSRVQIDLALAHQAVAMLALAAATVHAAGLSTRPLLEPAR